MSSGQVPQYPWCLYALGVNISRLINLFFGVNCDLLNWSEIQFLNLSTSVFSLLNLHMSSKSLQASLDTKPVQAL